MSVLRGLDVRSAVVAGFAGLCGAVLAVAAVLAFTVGVALSFSFFGDSQDHPLTPVLWFVVTPALAVGSGTVVALALGAGIGRALLVSSIAPVVGYTLSYPLVMWLAAWHLLPSAEHLVYNALITITPAALITVPLLVLAAYVDRTRGWWRMLASVAAVALFLLATVVLQPCDAVSAAVYVAVWVLVPMVAVVVSTRAEQSSQ